MDDLRINWRSQKKFYRCCYDIYQTWSNQYTLLKIMILHNAAEQLLLYGFIKNL